MTTIRRYSELIQIPDYKGRLDYLMLHGTVGRDTFGYDRIFNQMFYTSTEWRNFRDRIIVRDSACDMGLLDYEIKNGLVILHHMNCLTMDDIRYSTDNLMNPEFIICVSDKTHRFIHYGIDSNEYASSKQPIIREPNDMCPWRK